MYSDLRSHSNQNFTKQVRQQLRLKRNQLSKQQQQSHALKALSHLKNWLKLNVEKPSKIAFFLAQDGELNTQQSIEHLWQDSEHEIYLPVLETQPELHMGFCLYRKESKMKKNKFGIFEPDLPLKQHLSGEQLDVVIMPLVGFDKDGNRLGMGGGYYDRSFHFKHAKPNVLPKLIGWAHQCQQHEELPNEPWDVPLDSIITEKQIINWPR